MKNFLAIIGGIVVGFFVLMLVVFGFNKMNTPGLEIPAIKPYESAVSGDGTNARAKMTSADIAAKLDATMNNSMPGEFRSELDAENELYKVDMWNSFTRDTIESMQSGVGIDRWTEVRKELIDLTADMQSRFSDNGHPEITVVLSIVDPEDHDYVFATAARGVVGYDIVNGIDLLAENKES